MKNDNISRFSEKDIESLLIEKLGPQFAQYRKDWANCGRAKTPDFPIHIDFEMNDRCNQSCKMCPRNETTHPDVNYEVNTKAVLHFDTFKKVIDEGVPKGLRSVNLGAFAEPLLHSDVFKMIKYGHENGIVDSRLITNGLLLDKRMNEIFESGLIQLFVSVDAFSDEKYKEIRGSNLTKVRNNLLNFVEERKRRGSIFPIIRVSFVDMNVNAAEKQAFIDFWRDKVEMIDIQIYDNFNKDITKPYDFTEKKKWDCENPFVRVSVLANGTVIPCCSFFGRNLPIGEITKTNETIEEIWTGKAMQKVRQGIIQDDLPNCSICQRACS